MVNLKPLPGRKPLSSVTLIFKLPYYTHWGQSLVISGSEPILGSWNVKQALALSPVHQGDELFWCGRVAVPITFKCEYSYYLVDDNRNILRWEAGKKRKLALPDGVQEGDAVEIHDLWQVLVGCTFLLCMASCCYFNVLWPIFWLIMLYFMLFSDLNPECVRSSFL